MKLQKMSDDELKTVIEQLERTTKNSLDKYKRWEAEQKLKLAKSEFRKRQGFGGLLRRFGRLFDGE